jgi:disulfide bond formation protein DsbB
VAGGAMAASLYYSEGVGFPPCEFCWYQRIAMYPIAAILLIAAIFDDQRIFRYVLPIALIGAALSTYHYQLQLFPEQASVCSPTVPCHQQWVDEFGFVSIPLMALSGFVAIITLQVAMLRARAIED